jgi:predicted RND superfamily exporter protein
MDIMKHAEDNYSSDDGVKIRIDGVVMTIDELISTALSDALKAILSCTFVFLYLNFHTRSCFISALGMGIIILSFPLTAVITNGILQIKYFGFLQIMIIYIVLGIAADDIFVFYDAYQQSKEMDTRIMNTYEQRLAYSFRRSARAMAITSSTTAVAFFANGLSKLMMISAFGWFAGVIVPVNYLLVIMILPPAVVWYDTTIMAKDDNGNWRCPNCICWARCMKSKESSQVPGELALSWTERFFDEKVNAVVGHPIGKWVIIAVSLIWFGVSVAMTTQIEPLSEQEEFIDPDNDLFKTFTLIEEKFPQSAGSG